MIRPEITIKRRAYAYVRVSTQRQFDRGNSIVHQTRQVVAFADGKELDLGSPVQRDFGEHGLHETRENVFYEAESAKHVAFADRLQGGRLSRVLEKGDTVILAKLDRMFRSTADCLNTVESWSRRGITVYILNLNGAEAVDMTSPIGKLVLSVMAIVATFESDTKSERMRDWHAARDVSGLAHGRIDRLLFHRKRVGGKLLQLPCPDQRAHSRLFYDLYRQGCSVPAIVEYAAEAKMVVPGTRRAYARDRISASIRAEYQLRILAREMQLADDDPQVLGVWLVQTRESTKNARNMLPSRSELAMSP
jgi:DNA invertase Pin-like site-specific DNA recombinase